MPATNAVVSRGACVRYQLWRAARQLLAQNFKGKHKEQPLAHKITKKFQEILLKENIMPECLTIEQQLRNILGIFPYCSSVASKFKTIVTFRKPEIYC